MSWNAGWRLPQRIPLRLRVLFRGVFLLLALATIGLAFAVLQQEKEQGWRSYQDGFRKNQAQIVARLRHPTGQLALLNPAARNLATTPLRPLVLPFSAIDFDDKAKAQQAVEMAGCELRYSPPGGSTARDATLCVAVGNNPLAGGFIYAVGSFVSGTLISRVSGEKDLSLAHRARVTVAMRGQIFRWVAPFESAIDATGPDGPARGRLTGFAEEADGTTAKRPQRDFRGWLWQDGRCVDGSAMPETCERRSFFSIRLPIEVFREELLLRPRPAWPPADLDRIEVHMQMLPPGEEDALFDSNRAGATAPFSLVDLAPLLLPGESLRIRKADHRVTTDLIALKGAEDATQTSSPWLNRLIRQLPVEGYDQPIEARETLSTSLGDYELILAGDLRGVNRSLGVVATRLSWFVGAMLAAIALAWLVIELSVIRRITLLTRRAAAVGAVGRDVKAPTSASALLLPLDVADLRGSDELGLLAGVLGELLQRVNDDVKREQIRVAQERDQWHAVGHEIMSPLQSLLALHAAPDDPSRRYLGRMQQALRVLYGTASPSEAFESAALAISAIDVNAFLQHVANNAPEAGITAVTFQAVGHEVWVRADEYSLEDVVLHVLRNADRHRVPGTPIAITLTESTDAVQVSLHNVGQPIAIELLGRIFEYGVSDQVDAGALGSRGQGLFVARTYMAKMGGTITAENMLNGVRLTLTLQRATAV